MKVTRINRLTGKERSREINCTAEQLQQWRSGALIQTVMPEVSCDDREFIMTGITAEEWDATFIEELIDKS